MGSTFARINSVAVDPSFYSTTDKFLDAGWAAGTYASNTAAPNNPVAAYGVCYRGMPVGTLPGSGGIVPIAVANAVYCGVLNIDIDAYTVARNGKIPLSNAGRVRSYAGGALNNGDPVKADTSANFSGFVKWVEGTDVPDLRCGHAYALADGSNGAIASTMAQGDTIFVDLILN